MVCTNEITQHQTIALFGSVIAYCSTDLSLSLGKDGVFIFCPELRCTLQPLYDCILQFSAWAVTYQQGREIMLVYFADVCNE